MSIQIREVVDVKHGRNVARLIYDADRNEVYVETVGNHDGTVVCTAVQMSRVTFASIIRELGVM